MIIWEWRRLLRQRFRSAPNKPMIYKDVVKKKILVTFVLFSFGWHFVGDMLMDRFFLKVDEETGETYQISPKERKEEVVSLRKAYDQSRAFPTEFPQDA